MKQTVKLLEEQLKAALQEVKQTFGNVENLAPQLLSNVAASADAKATAVKVNLEYPTVRFFPTT